MKKLDETNKNIIYAQAVLHKTPMNVNELSATPLPREAKQLKEHKKPLRDLLPTAKALPKEITKLTTQKQTLSPSHSLDTSKEASQLSSQVGQAQTVPDSPFAQQFQVCEAVAQQIVNKVCLYLYCRFIVRSKLEICSKKV